MPGEGNPLEHKHMYSVKCHPEQAGQGVSPPVGLWSFFQAVRATLAKRATGQARPGADLDQAVRQIVSRAVAPEGVTDIFAAAGLDRPDISVLDDEFLAEIRDAPHPQPPRLPARQTRTGHPHRPRASRTPLRNLGRVRTRWRHKHPPKFFKSYLNAFHLALGWGDAPPPRPRRSLAMIDFIVWGKPTDLDVDNIIKPIQDALQGIVYANDGTVIDVCSRKINLQQIPRFEVAPATLRAALIEPRGDFVFIRIADPHTQLEFT